MLQTVINLCSSFLKLIYQMCDACTVKMKGFLKSREGIFQLSSNTTTIGRESCDLFLSVGIHSA